MAIRLSCDDGCRSDTRVAILASRYNLDCTFYIPVEWTGLAIRNGYEPLTFGELVGIASIFEIGSHGITHDRLTQIDQDRAEREIVESKFMLESLLNKEVTKFAPSRGYINGELKEVALEVYNSVRLTRGADLVHVHPNSGANDSKHWIDRYNEIKNTQEQIELWFHSWELDKFNMWQELEEFLENA